MSWPKTPDWLNKYFDEHAEICPDCQREVTTSNQLLRTGQTCEETGRFHICQEKHPRTITFKLPDEPPKLSFHVRNVKNCDSAKPAETEIWQKQGRAALLRYYGGHDIQSRRCDYHQPQPA